MSKKDTLSKKKKQKKNNNKKQKKTHIKNLERCLIKEP